MEGTDSERSLEQALQRIESSILPSLSLMLDSLIDAASLARPGADAAAYADEIRALAGEVETLTRQIQAVGPGRRPALAYSAA